MNDKIQISDSKEAKQNSELKSRAARDSNLAQQPKRFVAQDSITVETVIWVDFEMY